MVSQLCLMCGSTQNCQTLCLGARPRYNLVVDEDVKKLNQTKPNFRRLRQRLQSQTFWTLLLPLHLGQTYVASRHMLDVAKESVFCIPRKLFSQFQDEIRECHQDAFHGSDPDQLICLRLSKACQSPSSF